MYARGPLAFRRDRRKLASLCELPTGTATFRELPTGTVTFLFADIEGNGLCVRPDHALVSSTTRSRMGWGFLKGLTKPWTQYSQNPGPRAGVATL